MGQSVAEMFLERFLRASPDQQAAILRILDEAPGEAGLAETLKAERLKCTGAAGRFVFRRAEKFWEVVFNGGPEFYLPDTLGARYLDFLLHHPNEAISALDLEVAIRPERAEARSRNSIQGAADGKAVVAYLRELERLRAERDAARQEGKEVEAGRLEVEIEELEAAVKGAGRSDDAGERARGNVRKAIKAVVRGLLRARGPGRGFGEHLRERVSTGHECIYNQPEGRIWG